MTKHSAAIQIALISACALLLGGAQPAQGESIITELTRGGVAQPKGMAEGNGIDTVCDAPDGTDCTDSLFCNGTDSCLGGICVHSGDPCADSGAFCQELDDTCSDRPTFKLIYSNASDYFLLPSVPSGTRVADDILTEAVDDCRITAMKIKVNGNMPDGGDSFDTNVRLWDRCLTDPQASVIPGTDVTFEHLADDASIDHDLLLPMPNRSIVLPPSFWIQVGFSTRRAGWYFGQQPAVGFSADRYYHPFTGCHGWFSGGPSGPLANGNVEVYGERTCETARLGYLAAPSNRTYVPPLGPHNRVAEDLNLAVEQCELRAYEMSIRGTAGPYTASIDLRENLIDGPMPGTERVFVGDGHGGVETARFTFDEGIMLPKKLWMTWQVSRPSTGALFARLTEVGSSDPTFAGSHYSGNLSWTEGLTLGSGPAIFALSVYCRGDDSVGACCVNDGECRMLSENQCLERGDNFVGGPCFGDVDKDGVPDACDQCSSIDQNDSDNDGVVDDCDSCSASDIRELIVIDTCSIKIANTLFDDGCTMSDEIAACRDEATNHGRFVSCVRHLTKAWRRQELLENNDVGRILRCAAAGNDQPSPQQRQPAKSSGRP